MSSIVNMGLGDITLSDEGQSSSFDSSTPTSVFEYTGSDISPQATERAPTTIGGSEPESTIKSPHDVTVKSRKAIKRTTFSRKQVAALEARFIQQSFLCKEERYELSQQLNITERQVIIWFQNRRGRLKKRGTADAAYNPLKLSELNTRRPYPFLCGMLSSMHYQKDSSYQTMWTAYPDEVRNAAQTATVASRGRQTKDQSPLESNNLQLTKAALNALNLLSNDHQHHCQEVYAAPSMQIMSDISHRPGSPQNDTRRFSAQVQCPKTAAQVMTAYQQSAFAQQTRQSCHPVSPNLTMTSPELYHMRGHFECPQASKTTVHKEPMTELPAQNVSSYAPNAPYGNTYQMYTHAQPTYEAATSFPAHSSYELRTPPPAHSTCQVTSPPLAHPACVVRTMSPAHPACQVTSCSVSRPSSPCLSEYQSSFSSASMSTIAPVHPDWSQTSSLRQMDKAALPQISWAGHAASGHAAPTTYVNSTWHQTPYQLISQQ